VFSLRSFVSIEEEEGLAPNQADFSMARYEPMTRLMSIEDLRFLETLPGYRPEIGKKFVRERRRIFRMYLKELTRDFQRLHGRARAIAASMPAEHAPLIGLLIRQQIRFRYEMAAIKMRLAFDWLSLGAIDARSLVNAIGCMHAEVGSLIAPAAA